MAVTKKNRQSQLDISNPPPYLSQGVSIVLSTKLNKPVNSSNFVLRNTLIERLEKNKHLPFTLVSAATGCGKSATVSQWLDNTDHKYGWLSLDKEHNDVQVLLAYLVAMFKEVWPGKTFGVEYLLDGRNLPQNVIISTLINDIVQQDEQFVLVLDDYHVIEEERIHEIFNGILRHPPQNFHLVIITQMDPPLRLARLRAKFQLNELRMKDLSFTIDEALELRSLLAREARNDQVEVLLKRSDGWVTGITVGLMGMAQGIKFEKVLEALHSRNSIIAELLDEAVLHGLPVEIQKYLELASLVDRFSKDLICAMIAAIDDNDLDQNRVEELIRTSRKNNLFLIPLDNTGEWYRFHHLFQNQIRKLAVKHFNVETVASFYKAASGFFEQKELLEEALTYALRSADIDFAIRLFSRFRHQLLNSEQLQRLDRLTNQFPEEVRSNNPELLITLAMLQHYNANFIGMQQYLLRAEGLLNGFTGRDDHERELMGEYHGISTYLSYMLGDFEKAIIHGEKSMELLPADTPNFFREQATGWYAFARQACGHSAKGFDRLESEYGNLANADKYFQMRLLQGKLIFYLFDGNMAHLYHDGASLANLYSPGNYPGSWVIGIYSMAYHSYLTNQLEKVSGFHDELRKHRFACRPFWTIQHFFIECLSAMAKKSWKQVEQCIADCEELAEELAMEPLKGMVKAFLVEYYLRRHDVDSAKKVSALANFEPQPPTFFYYIPQLTLVKLLFQTQQDKKGQEVLNNLLELGRVRHNKNLLIQALTLQAVILYSVGNIDAAKKVVNDALILTKENKNTRVFLDHGEAMHRLLSEAAGDQPGNKQIMELLRAFTDEKAQDFQVESKSTSNRDIKLFDLSNRELETLVLVAQGLKNSEIADRLFVSTDTVKKHLYNAYQKLEVTNRTGAIKRIKSMGLVAS